MSETKVGELCERLTNDSRQRAMSANEVLRLFDEAAEAIDRLTRERDEARRHVATLMPSLRARADSLEARLATVEAERDEAREIGQANYMARITAEARARAAEERVRALEDALRSMRTKMRERLSGYAGASRALLEELDEAATSALLSTPQEAGHGK